MSKNNGNGKDQLRNGMLLDINENVKKLMEGHGEVLGELKALVVKNELLCESIKNTDDKVEKHIKDHKEKPKELMAPLIGKIGWKVWAAIIAALSCTQIAIAFLVLKFGPAKLWEIFK